MVDKVRLAAAIALLAFLAVVAYSVITGPDPWFDEGPGTELNDGA